MKRNQFYRTYKKHNVFSDLGNFTFWCGRAFYRVKTWNEVEQILG